MFLSIGITADIKKAFLQISLHEQDRDFLKFLWWQDINKSEREVKVFRHKRVVFGITTSPFLLSATIQYHLEKYHGDTASTLKRSFYVDNCITSVDSLSEMNKFVEEANTIMLEGSFELRTWVTGPVNVDDDHETISVLGLTWDSREDELFCKSPALGKFKGRVTKRSLLSLAQSIFDPIGFTCPTTLIPKLILQKCWSRKIDWDQDLPHDMEKEVRNWMAQMHLLEKCRIPRRLSRVQLDSDMTSLHVFCDASQTAYSACVFIRSEYKGHVYIQLVLAKARLAPIKPITMPRLELIAALMGSRLSGEAIEGLGLNNLSVYYWTDSSIVLAWIRKKCGLNVFVQNRVKEINDRTNADDWRHIPGQLNPADLPSRGCNATVLKESQWWEGPLWLKLGMPEWPNSIPDADVTEVNKEVKKHCVVAQCHDDFLERFVYFSSFKKVVRQMAWCLRFLHNCRRDHDQTAGNVTADEYEEAELKLFMLLQNQQKGSPSIPKLETVKDEKGIVRVKTRLTLLEETAGFRFPILLPGCHLIVERMVRENHKEHLHAGSQTLMNILREKFWIVGIRRVAKRIVRQCVTCKRFSSKHCVSAPAPLPVDRITCSTAFDVTGIDFAGPLYLRSGGKCWIALFTCATYRAVHLEICTSLSTEDFLMALRRFLARRGRVSIIYSDNGTNFIGASNLLSSVNWQEIAERTSTNKIKWRLIPPRAPWWGGFWERLVRSLKEIIRRVIGKAALTLTELSTLLCECEAVLNARPITYISDNTENLSPLTPAMFLQDIKNQEYGTEDLDQIDGRSLNARLRYVQKIRDDFKMRFRSEYLSLLAHNTAGTRSHRSIAVGDIVLMEVEGLKRIHWPLAIVKELLKGADGNHRVVRLGTSRGDKTRAIERIYPLELSRACELPIDTTQAATSKTSEGSPSSSAGNVDERRTRYGRQIKRPGRLDL